MDALQSLTSIVTTILKLVFRQTTNNPEITLALSQLTTNTLTRTDLQWVEGPVLRALHHDNSKPWVQLALNAVCVTASNCVNAVKDFVAAIRAVYSTVSLVVTVATVVMSKIIFRSWKRTKLREMARTLLFIQVVIGTSAHGTTTKNMDMENLYARMGPGTNKKNHLACFREIISWQ